MLVKNGSGDTETNLHPNSISHCLFKGFYFTWHLPSGKWNVKLNLLSCCPFILLSCASHKPSYQINQKPTQRFVSCKRRSGSNISAGNNSWSLDTIFDALPKYAHSTLHVSSSIWHLAMVVTPHFVEVTKWLLLVILFLVEKKALTTGLWIKGVKKEKIFNNYSLKIEVNILPLFTKIEKNNCFSIYTQSDLNIFRRKPL